MTSRQIGHAAAALALTVAAALPAAAADAMRVVRDPVTGELRGPNAAEAAALDKAEAQLRAQRSGSKAAARQPEEVHHPDGTIETKLGDDTLLYSVVAAAPDGSLTFDCLPARQAQQFVRSGGKLPGRATAAKAADKAGHAHP